MKGTNPETQGHRWAKRVKKRLKRERIEEGQWEELEQRKWDAFNAARDAKEAAEEGDSRHVPSDGSSSDEEPSEWNASAGDAGTSLRDEEGLDPEEAAAVRAVKAAAAAAAARLARLDDDDDDEKRLNRRARRPDASSSARRAPAARASSNPFAALGGPPRAARSADRRAAVDLPDRQHPDFSTAAPAARRRSSRQPPSPRRNIARIARLRDSPPRERRNRHSASSVARVRARRSIRRR